ncbi:Meiosis regulator and mRNA stability factor 1 [Linum grandiflorum]
MIVNGAGNNGSKAETQYAKAKTSVWWDIENCRVPKGCDFHAIAQNISSALANLNYCGPISIFAYGDTNQIPPPVQHALSSTGVSLNHVPPGGKNASDMRILVGMLLWAADNPAPANCLLISGDGDFSEALHQLRFRRYNILLAQPQNVSAPLVAAAKTVWLWTSLLAGGPPIRLVESSQPSNSSKTSSSTAMPQTSRYSSEHVNPRATMPLGNHIDSHNSRGKTVDSTLKWKPVHSNGNAAKPVGGLDNVETKQLPKAPHQFYEYAASGNSSTANVLPGTSNNLKKDPSSHTVSKPNHQNPNNQICPPSPVTLPSQQFVFSSNHMPPHSTAYPNHYYPPMASRLDNLGYPPMHPRPDNHGYPPMLIRPDLGNPSSSVTNAPVTSNQSVPLRPDSRHPPTSVANVPLPDISKLSISEPSSLTFSHGPPYGNTVGSIQCSVQNPSSSIVVRANPPMQGSQSRTWHRRAPPSIDNSVSSKPPPSDDFKSLIDVILRALDTLKREQVLPIQANISYCIRFGDPQHQNTDVKKALDCAIEHKRVAKQQKSSRHLFVRMNEDIWPCVDPIGGDPNICPEETWDRIKKFITSTDGRPALLASECRYKAALILKRTCLEKVVLGEVLQIIEMMIDVKNWITPDHHTKWKPVAILSYPEISKDRDKVLRI